MAWCVFGKLPGKEDFERLEPRLPRKELATSMLAEWYKVSKPGSKFEVREVNEETPVPVRRVPRLVPAKK